MSCTIKFNNGEEFVINDADSDESETGEELVSINNKDGNILFEAPTNGILYIKWQ